MLKRRRTFMGIEFCLVFFYEVVLLLVVVL